MAYGVDLRDLHWRCAAYVGKIMKGAKPGGLPVERPTRFEFFVNLKTATALGLTIPPSLLQRADQVIERGLSGDKRPACYRGATV